MTSLVDCIRYNDLPSLAEANISRQVCTHTYLLRLRHSTDVHCKVPFVDDVINGPIRDVFLKHAAHLTFCLYLQHRHHAISPDEAIVKVEGTAHLMDSKAVKEIASFGNTIVPTTWMTSGGKMLPMEFAIVPPAYVTFPS